MDTKPSGLPASGLVNGVFKGGGAKGVAYAGALLAVEEEGLWFGSVAGTSAGAITATLIAAGYDAREIARLVPELLRTVKCGFVKTILGMQDGIFDNQNLARALESLIERKMALGKDTPVTFQELHQSGITLYVVALDLATSTPLVFSGHTSPHVSVTSAVMASSAIPGAFPSARAIRKIGDGYVAHRLVDGGAWANFPRFVFQDESFRTWIQSTTRADLTEEEGRQTLQFALGDLEAASRFIPDWVEHKLSGPGEFDRGTLQSYQNPAAWLFGTFMSSHILRLVFGLGVAGMVIAIAVGIRREFRYIWTALSADQTGLTSLPLALTAAVTVFAAATVGMLLLIALASSRMLGSTLGPAAISALAVGTGVAPWVGWGANDFLIMVPFGKLKTTKFRVSQAVIDSAVERGYQAAKDQLSIYRTSGVMTSPLLGGPAAPPLVPASLAGAILAIVIISAPVALSIGIWFITESIVSEYTGWLAFTSAVAGIFSVAAYLVILSWPASSLHYSVSMGEGVSLFSGARGRTALVAAATLGVLALIGGVVWSSYLQVVHQASYRPAVISKAESAMIDTSGENTYRYTFIPRHPGELDGVVDDFTFVSESRLTVGDDVTLFVRVNDRHASVNLNEGNYQNYPRAVQFLGVILLMLAHWGVQIRRRHKALSRASTDQL